MGFGHGAGYKLELQLGVYVQYRKEKNHKDKKAFGQDGSAIDTHLAI
jgi:hypothetical protein